MITPAKIKQWLPLAGGAAIGAWVLLLLTLSLLPHEEPAAPGDARPVVTVTPQAAPTKPIEAARVTVPQAEAPAPSCVILDDLSICDDDPGQGGQQ
jgi:hypothetical protein